MIGQRAGGAGLGCAGLHESLASSFFPSPLPSFLSSPLSLLSAKPPVLPVVPVPARVAQPLAPHHGSLPFLPAVGAGAEWGNQPGTIGADALAVCYGMQ